MYPTEPDGAKPVLVPLARVSVVIHATAISGAGVVHLAQIHDDKRTNYSVYIRRSDRSLDHCVDFSREGYERALIRAAEISMGHGIPIEQVHE